MPKTFYINAGANMHPEPQTKPQTLEALLRRWAELEPDRCVIEGNYHGKPQACFYDVDLYVDMDLFSPSIPKDDRREIDAKLFWPVCYAIERRGWSWRVMSYKGQHAVARVWRHIMSEDNDVTSDTPAAALLSAYVQALEGQSA